MRRDESFTSELEMLMTDLFDAGQRGTTWADDFDRRSAWNYKGEDRISHKHLRSLAKEAVRVRINNKRLSMTARPVATKARSGMTPGEDVIKGARIVAENADFNTRYNALNEHMGELEKMSPYSKPFVDLTLPQWRDYAKLNRRQARMAREAIRILSKERKGATLRKVMF